MTLPTPAMRLADHDDGGRLDHDPTPAEIRRLCWRIQERWDQRTRRVRAGGPTGVSIPRLADV